jgi:hypothetical protein
MHTQPPDQRAALMKPRLFAIPRLSGSGFEECCIHKNRKVDSPIYCDAMVRPKIVRTGWRSGMSPNTRSGIPI